PNRVRFTDGRDLPCRTVIWTAGVTASPLVDTLDIETEKHRIVTRANLTVPGHEEILALGDAAAVPDLAKGHDAVCPPTAQHASRQGASAGRSVCAGLRGQPLRDYRHRDLGLVVDLGGPHAVANPLGITLSGLPAQVVTRAYHLAALPTFSRRAIVGADWLLHAVAGDPLVRLGFLSSRTGTLIDLENTEQYLNPEQLLAQLGAASTARKSA
ncbi:MAG: NAD(P)/FAD-dependent oxidoreductase, partial [Sciscionella sp.]